MGLEVVGVVLLLAGDGVEHGHGQVAGQCLGDSEAPGLCHQQVGGVHVLLHLVGEVHQLGGDAAALADLLLKGLVELLVAAGDDDDLHGHVGGLQLPVQLDDVGHAKAARHEQEGGQGRVQVQLAEHLVLVHVVEEHPVHRDTEGIDLLLGHAKGDELGHHVVAGHYIGVYTVADVSPVHPVVGDDADEGGLHQAVLLQVGDHLRGEGVGGDDHVGIVLADGAQEQVGEQAAELGHQAGEQVLLVGLLVQPAKEGGGLFGHEQVAVAHGLVQEAADGLQGVYGLDLVGGVLPYVLLHRGGGPQMPPAGGGGQKHDLHTEISFPEPCGERPPGPVRRL